MSHILLIVSLALFPAPSRASLPDPPAAVLPAPQDPLARLRDQVEGRA